MKELVASSDEKRTTIVYQLFDNVSYMVKKADGTRALPAKGRHGRYHVEGRLEIANREEVKRMVSTSIPLLRAGGQWRKVILTPTGRYKYNPCCSITGHVSNIRERNYVRWMVEKLTELKGTVRDYVRMRNIKRATVIEMGQLLTPTAGQSGYLHEEEVWGEDPVHLTAKGYSMAAAGLESLIYEKRGEERDAEEKRGHAGTVQEAPLRRRRTQARLGQGECRGGGPAGRRRAVRGAVQTAAGLERRIPDRRSQRIRLQRQRRRRPWWRRGPRRRWRRWPRWLWNR